MKRWLIPAIALVALVGCGNEDAPANGSYSQWDDCRLQTNDDRWTAVLGYEARITCINEDPDSPNDHELVFVFEEWDS